MVEVMSWKCQFGLADSLHGFKQIFDDCRDGSVTLCGPDPHSAVEIVRDGYGDIAHEFLRWSGFLVHSIQCVPMSRNYLQKKAKRYIRLQFTKGSLVMLVDIFAQIQPSKSLAPNHPKNSS